MSVDAHLVALEKRHTALDTEIASAMSTRPAMQDGEIAELKRRKLKLKEEIERLRASRPPAI